MKALNYRSYCDLGELRLSFDQRAGNANTTGQGQLNVSTIATDNSTHDELSKSFFVRKTLLELEIH